MVVKGVKHGEDGWVKAQGRKWNPDVGNFIIGVYKKTEVDKNPNNPKEELKRYIVESEGDLITVYGTTVLDDLFKDIPVGHEVCIEFTGTKTNKPPLSPTKLYEVHHRPAGQDTTSGAAGDDLEPENNKPTLNNYDPGEVAAFIQGVEEDVKGKGMILIEINMLQEAKEQIGDDDAFWNLVKPEIVKRYPAKEGE